MMTEASSTPIVGQRLPLRAENPARYWPLVFFVFVVHGAEEVLLDLPGWAREQRIDIPMISFDQGTLAVLIALLGVLVFVLAFVLRRNRRLIRIYLMTFLVIMSVYFVIHVLFGAYARSMEPGMITSILFLPVCIWLFTRVWAARPDQMTRT